VSIWATLGIAKTDDETAIRRAYSAKLKTIDEDVDRDAFLRLRAAYEQARRQAAAAAQEEQPDVEIESEAEITEERSDPASLALVDSPQSPPRATLEEEARSLERLLYGDGTREAIFPEVRAITERMLAHPDLELIDRRAAVETWLGQTILRSVPRSNAMLDLAIVRFGWAEAAQQWNCPPLVRAVLDRYRDAQIFDRTVRIPGATYYAPYRALLAPPDPAHLRWRPGLVSGVETFLATIDTRFPSLRTEFKAEDVAAWRDYIRKGHETLLGRARLQVRRATTAVGRSFQKWRRHRPAWRWGVFAAIIGFQVLRACTEASHG
jgi:hypothetical protein